MRLQNREQMRGMLEWFLDLKMFVGLKPHRNTKWVPMHLICLALLWCFSGCRCLTEAFDEASQQCGKLFSSFRSLTYQGFMMALVTWTGRLMDLLWSRLQHCMKVVGGKHYRTHGWLPLAVDGSRSSVARTQVNEKAFCAGNYGQGKTAKYRKRKTKGMRPTKNKRGKPQDPKPQVWITMLWHMSLRLPWRWKLGPSNSSERDQMLEMLQEQKYPKNTLFCADAGFVGFPLWSAIAKSGGHFLVRVGANAHLLRESAEYQIVKGGDVLSWPKDQQKKNAPLQLRLACVRVGKTKMYLLTNVLKDELLNEEQMVEFYKMRWGIEVEFRGLKQTLDKAKLLCRNDKRVLVELNWSIMAMAVAELFALKTQLDKRRGKRSKDLSEERTPARRSLAKTMRAIRGCLRALEETPKEGRDLQSLLYDAVTDNYQRKKPKKARYCPKNKDKKKLGKPKLRMVTKEERAKIEQTQTA